MATRRPSYDPGFSTETLTTLYSPESTVSAMLEFEAALALALGESGIAPKGDVEGVAAACQRGVSDAERILESTWETGTPIIALRDEIDAGEWFHFGATSQDAIDTGQMVQAERALGALDDHLTSIASRLRDLTIEHRDQPQMGRTFLQDALPTTFGFRTATWLDPVLEHIEELRAQRSSLPVQLGGPVGTRDSYGNVGEKVVEAVAARLGLRVPEISWHSDRSAILSVAQAVERSARTMARIGSDLAFLSSTPVREVVVRSGDSSSMPGKQNPIDAIRAVAAASACIGAVAMLTSAPAYHLDRAVGSWHVEWVAVPLVFQTAGAATESIDHCLESLRVEEEAMGNRIDSVGTPNDQIERVIARYDQVFS